MLVLPLVLPLGNLGGRSLALLTLLRGDGPAAAPAVRSTGVEVHMPGLPTPPPLLL